MVRVRARGVWVHGNGADAQLAMKERVRPVVETTCLSCLTLCHQVYTREGVGGECRRSESGEVTSVSRVLEVEI